MSVFGQTKYSPLIESHNVIQIKFFAYSMTPQSTVARSNNRTQRLKDISWTLPDFWACYAEDQVKGYLEFNSDMKGKFYLVSSSVYNTRDEFITSSLGYVCIHDSGL